MSRYLCIHFKYMFNVSICEYFSVLNVCIVCIRNTARSKSIPLLCTHVDSYKISTVHPPSMFNKICDLIVKELKMSVEHGKVVATLHIIKH
jgi:hypothetical protein